MDNIRKTAALAGEAKFVGTPCRTCGSTARYTSNGNCVSCSARHAEKYNTRMRELVRRLKAAGLA